MTAIYRPRNRAHEYAEYAFNVYDGCPNACAYCYVPGILRRDRATFHNYITPREEKLTDLVIDCRNLDRRIRRGLDRQAPILLSFTCDPYPPIERKAEVTRTAIAIIRKYDLNFCILTKNTRLAMRDLSLYRSGDEFATTLTLIHTGMRNQWEPFADSTADRIQGLRAAHNRGITTWVSLEPVIDPQQSLKLIGMSHQYVDFYKVGKLNHHPRAAQIDWRQFTHDAIVLLHQLHKPFLIKEDLKPYINEEDIL